LKAGVLELTLKNLSQNDKKVKFTLFLIIICYSCSYSSSKNDNIGQLKKAESNTSENHSNNSLLIRVDHCESGSAGADSIYVKFVDSTNTPITNYTLKILEYREGYNEYDLYNSPTYFPDKLGKVWFSRSFFNLNFIYPIAWYNDSRSGIYYLPVSINVHDNNCFLRR
jgi:hypothetical protein